MEDSFDMLLGLFSETACNLVTNQLTVPEIHEQQPTSFHQFDFSMDRKQLTGATQRLMICLFDLAEHLCTTFSASVFFLTRQDNKGQGEAVAFTQKGNHKLMNVQNIEETFLSSRTQDKKKWILCASAV